MLNRFAPAIWVPILRLLNRYYQTELFKEQALHCPALSLYRAWFGVKTNKVDQERDPGLHQWNDENYEDQNRSYRLLPQQCAERANIEAVLEGRVVDHILSQR